MRTPKQDLGDRGVRLVITHCKCPKCKSTKRTLRALPNNFKCADVICDFCGYLAQVKAKTVPDVNRLSDAVPGAAWGPQKERMDAGIFFPLFLVQINGKRYSIFYLSADLQSKDLFVPRKPLSANAHRAGWQGFRYDLKMVQNGAVVRLR
jgi:hypothetical protein